MDPTRKNDSVDRQREEALARRLGEALDQIERPGADPCPDAELIAAYHERALATDEVAHCEAHFASCSRCRKILAVLAASDDTPLAEKEVARLGELVAAVQVPRETAPQIIKPDRKHDRWDWRARWLAPALGVAAALAVWFAIRPPWRTLDQGTSGTLVAQLPKNEIAQNAQPPALDQSSKVVPTNGRERESAAPSSVPRDQSLSKTESAKKTPEPAKGNSLDNGGAIGGLVPSAGVSDGVSRDQKEQKPGATATATGAPTTPPVPAAPPAPALNLQADLQEQAVPAPPEPRPAVNAPVRALAAPPARVVPQNKSAMADKSVGAFAAASRTIDAGIFASPSGAVSWRVGANGRIERTTDAGRTWIPQASPLQQEWLAGAAVSNTVCWIVGRNGAIARTTDGEHWQQIVPPAVASGKLPDWIAVTASDAQMATITTSDQRRYATQDGGKTWREQF